MMRGLVVMIAASAGLGLTPVAVAQDVAIEEARETDAASEAQRAALNREQAEFARRQLEENAANQRAYEDAVKARDIEIASRQEEYARVLQRHEEAMELWRADVAACRAGDRRRCAAQ